MIKSLSAKQLWRLGQIGFAILGTALPLGGWGADVQTLGVVEVKESGRTAIGTTDSASQGTVLREQLEARPAYRPVEVLEALPGLIVMSHSGEGKANQYFLRGFNLDHGTDLAVVVDGMPANQRSHAHAQGYLDLAFFIPELAGGLQHKKGPYYADEGDFAAAGAVHVDYVDALEKNIAEIGAGAFGVRRALFAGSPKMAGGSVLYALELFHNDGPWTNPDDFRKLNAVLRYSRGSPQNGFSLAAMAYRGKWNSTDQIPQRAVNGSLLGRFDAVDPSDGGEAHRYSVSGKWQRTEGSSVTRASAYMIASRLDLFNNFTYFFDDPVNGDQFQQSDKRVLSGLSASHVRLGDWRGYEVENTVGLQLRNDNISTGLFGTRQRQRLSTTREDHVVETSAGIYFQNSLRWSETFRTVAGVRADFFRGDVTSNNPANSGKAQDHLVSPKLSLILGPWAKTEYFLNLGRGFHSNDARGTTITVDPKDPSVSANKVPLLVRATGAEIGLRSAFIPHLQTSLALFRLDFDSELLFVGDAGTTEPSRPSRRTGIEFSNFYTPIPWLTLDADFAFTQARFTDPDPAGNRIPGAVEGVVSVGASIDHLSPYFGALQLRYFGPRPLIEDNSVRSKSTTLLSGRIGYKIDKNLRIQLDGFNLLNRSMSQIDYFYTSRLPGEPASGVSDIHFHPAESRSLRLTLISSF